MASSPVPSIEDVHHQLIENANNYLNGALKCNGDQNGHHNIINGNTINSTSVSAETNSLSSNESPHAELLNGGGEPLIGGETNGLFHKDGSAVDSDELQPRCTGCKSKKLDAVAKCIDCANYLCANCVTAHQFMHCFDGHSVFRIKNLDNNQIQTITASTEPASHNVGMDEFNHHHLQHPHQHLNNLNGDQLEVDDLQFINNSHLQQQANHHHLQMLQQQQMHLHHHQQHQQQEDQDIFGDQQFLANKIMNSFDAPHRLALSFKDDILGLTNGSNGLGGINGPTLNGGGSSNSSTGSCTSSGSSSSGSSSASSTTAATAINFMDRKGTANGIIGSGLSGLMMDSSNTDGGKSVNNCYFCPRHKNELLKYFCRTCQQQICKDCIVIDHSGHEYELVMTGTGEMGSAVGVKQQIENLMQIVTDVRSKATDVRTLIKSAEYNNQRLLLQYRKAQTEINETYNFFRTILDDRKQDLCKELENVYNCKSIHIDVLLNKTQEHIDKVLQSCEFVERLAKQAGPAETVMLRKVMENKLQSFLQYVQDLQSQSDLEFLSNYQAIQVSVRNTFGYIRSSPEHLTNAIANGNLDTLTANNNLINSIVSNGAVVGNKQPPIARPSASSSILSGGLFGHQNGNGGTTSPASSASNGSLSMGNLMNGHNHHHHTLHQNGLLSNGLTSSSSMAATTSSSSNSSITNGIIIERPFSNGNGSSNGGQNHFDSSNMISKRLNAVNSLGPFVGDLSQTSGSNVTNGNSLQLNPYEKWSNGGSDSNLLFNTGHSLLSNGSSGGLNTEQFSQLNLNGSLINDHSSVLSTTSVIDLTNKLMSAGGGMTGASSNGSAVTSIFPPKSQIKRQKMIYHCKFGEFGVMEGQFTEPSGVAVNAQNDIIVADTNNHRIQIFDKEGRFKFQFGECGKRDGQLLYPNRVAVVRTSGDIIVTERSPTHQIQIYNQYGQFVRKFGANILQHPRGVTVDNKGLIIVVECKVMRVIIFDQNGVVLQKFGCSKQLEFPNGVVVNDKQEIFISDNRAHCVKVFNYEGVYLRQIGGEGITNYPIGVGINLSGEILIADNHNNFNLTIFTQDGQLVSALESKVKHAQCFDVALMDDGSVVLASKDYRLYIYRYVQVPPIGL